MMQQLQIRTSQPTQLIDITAEIRRVINSSGIDNGLLLVVTPHTTAALTINENADPDVTADLINSLNRLVPHAADYRHAEGNSAAHIKCSLIGTSEQLIIQNGELLLGTWQGIYFCEFDGPRSRKLYVKLIEERAEG